MKKRKILVLFPLVGLLLSGCTVQEGFEIATKWFGDNIVQPFKDFFHIDDDQKEDEGGSGKEVTAVSIKSVSAPEYTYVDEEPALSEYSLVLTMSDGSEKKATPDKVDLDVSTPNESAEGVAHYKTLEKKFFIEVRENPAKTEHAGTEEDPLTGADAVIIAQSLEESSKDDKHPSEKSYYIKGVVQSMLESFNPQFGNFTFTIEEGFEGYRLKNGPQKLNFTNEGDLEVGDTVTMYAQILNFKGTYETSDGYIAKIEKKVIDAKLTEITFEGEPQTSYLSGAAYNHDGLSVIAHYDNGETQNVTNLVTWELSKETAEVGDETLTISATYLECGVSMAITVTVNDSSSTVHQGTAEDPYSILDCEIVYAKENPEQGKDIGREVYVAGTILADPAAIINYGRGRLYIGDDSSDNSLYIYNINNVGGTNDLTLEDIPAGSKVVAKGTLKNYNGMQLCYVKDVANCEFISIEKPVIEGELVSISIEGEPKTEYLAGAEYNYEGLSVVAHYDNEETQVVTSAATWELSKETAELGDESITITAHYEGFDAQIVVNVTVTEGSATVHAGTVEDPYSIADCETVYANENPDQGKDIGREVYVAGTILAEPAATISSGRGKLHIGDDSSENSLYIYNINNIGGTNNLTLADIPAGSKVVAKGTLKNYNGMQLCYVNGVANCEFISIEKPVIAPETIEITSGSELAIGSAMTLTAKVGPEGAEQDVEWEIVSGGDYATLSEGVLTGVASGEVTVKATAVGYENVYAEKTITVSSSVVPTEQAIYTLDGTVTGGSSGYAEASAITQNNVQWAVVGNTTMNPWRIGGKNLSGVDRTVTCKAAFADDITKVVVTTGTKTLSAINSITLLVGSSEGASDVDSIQLTENLVSADLEYARPEGHSWANCYFTIVFNVNAASSNQYIQLLAVNLYAVK